MEDGHRVRVLFRVIQRDGMALLPRGVHEELAEIDLARRFGPAQHDQRAQLRQIRGDRPSQAGMVEPVPPVDGHEHDSAHTRQKPRELTPANRRHDRSDDRPKPCSRQVQGASLPPVRQLHGHDLIRPDPKLVQRPGEPLHQMRVLTVGDDRSPPLRSEGVDRHRIRTRVTPLPKIGDETGIPPPTIGPILLRHIRRSAPGSESDQTPKEEPEEA